jgi:hypothetical protein
MAGNIMILKLLLFSPAEVECFRDKVKATDYFLYESELDCFFLICSNSYDICTNNTESISIRLKLIGGHRLWKKTVRLSHFFIILFFFFLAFSVFFEKVLKIFEKREILRF